MALLRIINGDQAGNTIEIGADGVTIGRAADNTIPLDDLSTSGHHLRISRQDGRLTLQDLDSTNGTLLNGKPVKESPLKPGDVIAVGAVQLSVEGDDIEVAAEAPVSQRSTSRPPTAKIPLTVLGPSPFGAKKDTKWIWLTGIILVGVLVLAALAWFLMRLFES